jgi:transposase
MFNLSQSIRIFVCTRPTDMRNSFRGLIGLTKNVLQQDPYNGHLFIFQSKRGDFIKILWWDLDGFAIFSKRLEAGSFSFPPVQFEDGRYLPVEIERAHLLCLLEGIDHQFIEVSKKKKCNQRYTRKRQNESLGAYQSGKLVLSDLTV